MAVPLRGGGQRKERKKRIFLELFLNLLNKFRLCHLARGGGGGGLLALPLR